ncbi:TetR/AcrR family transcriptional regulator [Lactococcus fujiensis]|nr:TetR/AcrR family transcriptional regulator [Lactococcus fujiensis]
MVKNTRENIINALFRIAIKHPEKSNFTINEIALEAGISRQAIYQKHYRNVAEILEDVQRPMLFDIGKVYREANKIETSDPFVFLAEQLLPVLYKHREWLRVFYTTCMDPTWIKRSEERMRNWIKPYLKIEYQSGEFSREVAQNVLAKSMLVIITTWLSQDFPPPPDTFKYDFLYLLQHSVEELLLPEFRIK